MTLNDGFDRVVSHWLDDQAGRGAPGYLDDVLARTTRTRQRPAWSSLERWLPMETTLHFAPAPRMAWLLVALAALLVVGLVATFIGSQQTSVMTNGAVIYGSKDGDIYVFDPATGKSTPLVSTPGRDTKPFFSRDGAMFAFVRNPTANPGRYALTIADAHGTTLRSVEYPRAPTSIVWSPDGARLLVVDSSPDTLSIVSVDGGGTREIETGMRTEQAFWRPDGRQIVFEGVTSINDVESHGIYVVSVEGTGLRSILPPVTSKAHVQEPALSPDGTQVVYGVWDGDSVEGGNLYVTDVDSGDTRVIQFGGGDWEDYFPAWSPSGKQLVFTRGRPQESYHLAVGPAAGGDVVRLGRDMPWDAGVIAAFSPDGSKVIAQYSDGSIWIFDATGGPGTELDIQTHDLPSWQGLHP